MHSVTIAKKLGLMRTKVCTNYYHSIARRIRVWKYFQIAQWTEIFTECKQVIFDSKFCWYILLNFKNNQNIENYDQRSKDYFCHHPVYIYVAFQHLHGAILEQLFLLYPCNAHPTQTLVWERNIHQVHSWDMWWNRCILECSKSRMLRTFLHSMATRVTSCRFHLPEYPVLVLSLNCGRVK